MKSLLKRYYYLFRSLACGRCSYLIFFVTSKCNAHCKMCFYWREISDAQVRKILSLEEIDRIARNFKNLIYVSITGGEPCGVPPHKGLSDDFILAKIGVLVGVDKIRRNVSMYNIYGQP